MPSPRRSRRPAHRRPSDRLTAAAITAGGDGACHGVEPGDTIEVHRVHSSCDVAPGKGLGSCISDKCANPQLRVEAQVFLVVNDSTALKFSDFALDGATPRPRGRASPSRPAPRCR